VKTWKEKLKNLVKTVVYSKVVSLTFVFAGSALVFTSCASLMLSLQNRYKVKPNLEILINKTDRYPTYLEEDPVVRLGSAFNCSGVTISDKYILTAAHCVDSLNQMIAVSTAKDVYIGSGEVVGIFDKQDVALIQIDINNKIRPIKVDFTGKVCATGHPIKVAYCGFPQGQLEQLCSVGTIHGNSLFMRTGQGIIYEGMSGGPVIAMILEGFPEDSDNYILCGVNSAVTLNGTLVGPVVGLPKVFNLEISQ